MISFRIRSLSDFFARKSILILLWLFLLVFPKGGIKAAGIPITWGYISLAFVSISLIFRNRFYAHTPRLQALLFLFPFQVISFYTLFVNGIESAGFTISFILCFFFLPALFFLLLSSSIEHLDFRFLCVLIKNGMFYISLFGIFLFFFKIFTGSLIEIPFLTINFHDMGEIEQKCNNRGLIFKLISTYNNGNLYGICLLIFLSFYSFLEKSNWRKWIVKGSLILTFSRTVWIGLVFSELLTEALVNRNKKTFLLKIILIPSFFILILISVTILVGFDYSFFLDSNLGGRVGQLDVFKEVSFISYKSFGGIFEIVYLGILEQFGLLGLIAYVAGMGGPIFLSYVHFKKISQIRASLLCGLLTYLFVSASDGALLLIPVTAFYWFSSSLLLRRELSINQGLS